LYNKYLTTLYIYIYPRIDQRLIQINIYCCENTEPKFITDSGVHKVGTVTLHLSGTGDDTMPKRREIQTRMQFGETVSGHLLTLTMVGSRPNKTAPEKRQKKELSMFV
jgi:hypothetical protein